MKNELLKKLPKIDDLLMDSRVCACIEEFGRNTTVEALRESVDFLREGILNGQVESVDNSIVVENALEICKKRALRTLRKVINATGTILHTNLGRSRLSEKACEAVIDVAKNYSNLEYNIEKGSRGERYDAVTDLLKKLTGAESSLVVNNNAAAVLLALSAVAHNKRVIVSRGEQVEIGGMFRVPEIMEQSGSHLVEVGTTNKTHLRDYESKLDENSVILKVHTSNYKIIGFTQEVEVKDLAQLGKKHNLPVIYDLGSGSLVDFGCIGIHDEPTVQKTVADGADIVTFSGDKLLGGPQAGIIVGSEKYINMMKKHPLTRAMRIDKMTIAALEATLREYLEEDRVLKNIPVLGQILSNPYELQEKAVRLNALIDGCNESISASIIKDKGAIGGGSMPGHVIDTYCIELKSETINPNAMEMQLRQFSVPVIARISNNALILDVLTIDSEDFDYVADCIKQLF